MNEVSYVIKRDGKKVSFNRNKIFVALEKCFAELGQKDGKIINELTDDVLRIIEIRFNDERPPHIEQIQDIVELMLIKNNYAEVAKAYILYRDEKKREREQKVREAINDKELKIKTEKTKEEVFSIDTIKSDLTNIAKGLKVNVEKVVEEVLKSVYNGITKEEVHLLTLNTVKSRTEQHYDYSSFASRLVLNSLYQDILDKRIYESGFNDAYKDKFEDYIKKGIDLELLNPELAEFDLKKIEEAIDGNRDKLFMFLGTQTITDRYLLRDRDERAVFELPQWMWMRVSMGLALLEEKREERAIEFYNVLSNLYAVSSTPTLFNSGTTHSQMSSCYVNYVDDSLSEIFKTYSDCGQLSKWAGGIGTDWTAVRAKGAKIKGTNGDSQGIIPFIKIYNDIALAVNQGGKRRGAMAAYLEVWHRDIEEFLDLRKNTGDERRRAHDIHTAAFIPDLFMKRVKERGDWTLFSPDQVPDLHSSYGKEFEKKYAEYENKEGIYKKKVKAFDLWKLMLTRLYETGHPWITFKDALNVRNPQDHKGMIHSSNLCTEIALNTSPDETAVCNLASINLSKMIVGEGKDGKLNENLIESTLKTVMRMLDNVIDVNFYPIPEADKSNKQHRPVGLGMMGYQDALYQLGIDFDSDENIDFADKSMEMVSYHAIMASSKLAKEKGAYPSFEGSKWDRGLLPIDTVQSLEDERGEELKVNKGSSLDWGKVREHIKEHGMRNSNCMAIAPTATIANISGTTPSVEPTYKNIYMKENLSGNFIVVNRKLIDALSELNLWNPQILRKIKLKDGSVIGIDEIPADIQRRFKESFEIDSKWVVKAAAVRGKWIDQSASTNIFLKTTSGKVLNDVYMGAWEHGLKTTYYLRTLGASQVTKTISNHAADSGSGASSADPVQATSGQASKMKEAAEMVKASQPRQSEPIEKEVKLCSLADPDCESCQ